MTDPLVHPAHDDHGRRVGGEHHVTHGGQSKRERDRYASEHRRRNANDKKHHQVQVTQLAPQRLEQHQQQHQTSRDRQRLHHLPGLTCLQQLQQRENCHRAKADDHRRHPPRVADLERRRQHHRLLDGVLPRVGEDDQQKSQCSCRRQQVEEGAPVRCHLADQGRHPHVLAALERHGGTEHGQPQKQYRGEFVRPDQRVAKQVARDHAGQQHDDLCSDKQGNRYAQHAAQKVLCAAGPGRDRPFG